MNDRKKDNFYKIPQELRDYPQWIVWREEQPDPNKKPTKVPYHAKKFIKADVTDKKNFSTFDEAIKAYESGRFSGISFCLTEEDPFVFIDIDDANGNEEIENFQISVIGEEIDTYTEKSPSGKGFHIIGKGSVPRGANRKKLEIYSSKRAMTMTGDIASQTLEIKDIQEKATQIHAALQPPQAQLDFVNRIWDEKQDDSKELHDDNTILEMAFKAKNKELFIDLFEGNWDHHYDSNSDADHALIAMIAYYSKNRNQTQRIFMMSALGKRPKINKTRSGTQYLDYSIDKVFANIQPPFNLEELKAQHESYQQRAQVKNEPISELPQIKDTDRLEKTKKEDRLYESWEKIDDVYVPPGLVGDIMRYTYASSPKPFGLVSLIAGITLVAGVSGRSYNVMGSGLNLYILLLMETSVGKDALKSSLNSLIDIVVNGDRDIPAMLNAEKFKGPDFASAQGMVRHLSETSPCVYSIWDEAGIQMTKMGKPGASANLEDIKKFLLAIYGSSGKKGSLNKVVYSKEKDSIKGVKSPSLTLVGESVPSTLIDGLTEEVLSGGLLARFITLEYMGQRKLTQKGHHKVQPDKKLILAIQELCEIVLQMENNYMDSKRNILEIELSPEADEFNDSIDAKIIDICNATKEDPVHQMYGRVQVKVMKLAGVIAVGINPMRPLITLEIIQWAYDIVIRDVEKMLYRYEHGLIGKAESNTRQIYEVEKEIKKYLSLSPEQLYHTYYVPLQVSASKIVTYSYLSKKCLTKTSFKNDRLGATASLKNTLKQLEDVGDLRQISKAESLKVLGVSQLCYAVINFEKYGV